jgi:hypothetical protein
VSAAFELTIIRKAGGSLTKRISLGSDGKPLSDGSECVMSRGSACRARFSTAQALARLIGERGSNEAILLGTLRSDLPDEVDVVTKSKLNGAAASDVVSRTAEFFVYRSAEPAFALIDFDQKGMPLEMARRLAEAGGVETVIARIIPEFMAAGRVMRSSTSAGLFRGDNGEELPHSGGLHIFVAVRDGADVKRFLQTLHERCWLAGWGWMLVGAGGQLLERSIVDRVVGGPERLIFEGAPVLIPPIAQDLESRRPIPIEGGRLDTVLTCPHLTIVEKAKLKELRAKETQCLVGDSAKARESFVDKQSRQLASRAGMDLHRACRIIERQCDGVLLPDVVLSFDDKDLEGKTVADVLADPARFEGETLADPLEGVEYGRCKARIMRRADGTPWINSFAHGHTVFELKFDYRAAHVAMEKAATNEAADIFVSYALAGDLDESEIEALRNLAQTRSGVSKRALDRTLKVARRKTASRRLEEEHDRRLAERQDTRPQIPAPSLNAEWLPTMGVLNAVLGCSAAIEPPMRDFEGYVPEIRSRGVSGLHALTSLGSNQEDTDETRLPPPEQLLLSRLGEPELGELIERHIEFVDEKDRPVHLLSPFVKHYLKRSDEALPLVTGLSTMPIVLPNGLILTGPGLMRRYNTVFRVPAELCDLLPKQEDCSAPAVSRAMRFLTHNWLCDVATTYEGRCIIVACALTIIERSLLPMRPAFLVRAGKRGGGKTTTLNMISTAVLGHTAAAAAWSPNEEERRKALFAYFLEGVPFLVWDNIARGTTVSCPSIEKSLTAEFYSDRVLGVSEPKFVPITTVQAFTGNNIAPRGDMSSRALQVIIGVNRPDPENRQFKHPDPIGWTKAHRGQILSALYTILAGNPRRRRGHQSGMLDTRFKEWMDLIGSAVEHAAEITASEIHGLVVDPLPICPPSPISFKTMFLAGEAGDEEDAGLATLLCALRKWKWKREFRARDLAVFLEPENSPPTEEAREMLAALTLAAGKPIKNVSPSTVTWCLKKLVDAPVQVGKEVLILKCNPDRKNGDTFLIDTPADEARWAT